MGSPGEGRRAERRLVHVLFADLVGFTTLAEELDAEDVALLQEHYFGRVQAAVTAAGGQVEKYIGDAVVAIFGLPTVRPDDARRAVDAGLAIVASLAEVEAALGVDAGTLRVRVGVHTGEVVVTWGDAPGSWRLSGDVVNTAARLQAAAAPGTVLVGPDTALSVAPAVALEALGEVALKGKAERVTAWRVLGPGDPASAPHEPPDAADGTRLPLLGRERDLARLGAAHREAAGGALVVVLAPPGVGRSRLVEEFAARARAAGAAAWRTTVRPGRGGYAPVADLLRQALTDARGTDLPTEDALLARLARHGHHGPRALVSARHVLALLADETPDATPAELWTSWTAVLDAEDGPTPVWIVDDAHRAGPDLRAFLEHALAGPHREARLMVATARPGREEHPPEGTTVLALDPLPDPVVRELVEQGLPDGGEGGDRAPLVDEITRAAGGNPLFVTELLRAWRQLGARTGARVPSTVAAIYLGQLDDLPVASRAVLETGSVAGTTLPAPALPGLGIPDPADALRELTGTGLLSGPHDDPVDPLSYTYRHVLLRDAAYATLPRARRASLHLRFADWLEAGRVPRRAEHVGMHLAAAWEQAPALGGPVDGVVPRADLAGRAAARLTEAGEACLGSEPHRAVELFVRARDLGGPEPSPERAHRQLRIAQAWRRAGRLPEAMEAFAAVAGAEDADSFRASAAAALGFEDALFDSRLPRDTGNPRALALLDDALARTPGRELALRSRLLAARARGRAYGAGGTDAESAAAEGAAGDAFLLARRAGDPGAVAYALLALRPTLADPRRLGERLRVDEALVAATVEAGDAEREFEARRLCYVDRLEHGDADGAAEMQAAAEALALTLGRGVDLWYPPMWRAMGALHRGDLDAAATLVEDFRREGERWHYRDTDQVHAVQFLTLHSELGTPEEALPVVARVVARVEAQAPRIRLHRGVALARAGQYARAREELDALRPDGFAAVGIDGARTFLLAEAAEIADAVGDLDAGAQLHELLAPAHEHLVVVGSGALCIGAVAHYRGLAARAAGDRATAAAHFREAVARNVATGAVRYAARSRDELARTTADPVTRCC